MNRSDRNDWPPSAPPSSAVLRPSRRFWSLWLLGVAAAGALTLAASVWPYFPGDLQAARVIQAEDPRVLDTLFDVVNSADGGIPALTLAAVGAAAFLLARRADLLVVFLALNALRPASGLLKWLTDRPRPSPDLIRVGGYYPGNTSFPSGHVVTAVLLFGGLAVLVEALPVARAPRRAVQAACLAVLLLIGPARVDVGAHWPSDALGGYLWGALILIAVTRTIPWRRARAAVPGAERVSGGGA